ncbi:hypothetical protein BCF74_1082 [Knoellia remsis]|uniref:Uncharacterized protein n=1 Tax=Knoellia remsis TaxID=407159 RepID=A0A2T0UQB1_9MICO|nr:hypothetical protein BCF74_1082 [Knoellia remsis]
MVDTGELGAAAWWPAKRFTIGLPAERVDGATLADVFDHVADRLKANDAIALEDVVAVTFDGEDFTIVWDDSDGS